MILNADYQFEILNLLSYCVFPRSALHWAALLGKSDLCSLLLDSGARYPVRDANGATPLHYAVRSADLETIKALTDRKQVIDNRSQFTIFNENKNSCDTLNVKGLFNEDHSRQYREGNWAGLNLSGADKIMNLKYSYVQRNFQIYVISYSTYIYGMICVLPLEKEAKNMCTYSLAHIHRTKNPFSKETFLAVC